MMKTYEDFVEKNFSFFGKGLKVQGDFEFEGDVRVCGHLLGTIHCQNGCKLSIEPEGKIEGNLDCEQIEIMGSFIGELNCSGRAVFHPSSSITGKVKAKGLVILPGAIVNIQGDTISEKEMSSLPAKKLKREATNNPHSEASSS